MPDLTFCEPTCPKTGLFVVKLPLVSIQNHGL